MATGQTRPLAAEEIHAWVLSPNSGVIYMLRGRRLESQNVEAALVALRGTWRIADLPSEVAEAVGGLSMDADGRTLYAGVRFEAEGQWGVMACDTKTSRWTAIARVNFKVGNVQAHPTVPAFVMFRHDMDGNAPQRMWIARDNGGRALPLYKEWYKEWVTHEVWWGHRVLFTLWPDDQERLQSLHGIASVDLWGQDFKLHGRYPARQTHGSPDGKLILGDDADSNIWLIAPYSGERRLLTQGHNAEGFETHPRASFTPDGQGVLFQSSRLGKETIMVAEIPEWESLPKDE